MLIFPDHLDPSEQAMIANQRRRVEQVLERTARMDESEPERRAAVTAALEHLKACELMGVETRT